MDNQQYTYYAFISYQRKDEKWAKWLQHKLENYKLPVANAKDTSDSVKKPKYIRPVFRDKTDLTAGPLPNALKEALNQSRYLIVICSPNAVQSPWVNDEINTFVNADRTKFIIPFIVDGEPYSDDKAKECFPDALKAIPKEQEPLGVNIGEGGKQRAFIRTVAYMLGVKFDELWNRYERHRRKIRNIAIACLAFLAVIALGIYDYTRTKVEYYADWVDCNGVAQGVIPLTDEQYTHRYASYKFEYTRVPFGEKGFYSWRLNKVSLVNSKGVVSSSVPDNPPFFYPIQEYRYTDGYVTEIINRDTYNRVVMRYTIKDDYDHKVACLVDMEGKEKHQGSAYLSSSTTAFLSDANSNNTMSRIKRFHYTRNEKGYITKVTYHANDADELDESAIGDNNNIYGKVFDLDSHGRVAKVTFINHEGNPMTDKYGVGSIRYNNAAFEGNDTVEYLGNDGKLAYNEHKFARRTQKLDKYGNPVEQWYDGADGKPCYDYKNIYRQVLSYDDNGSYTEMKCFDFDGKLSYCSDNYAIQKVKYDSKGRHIEVSYFDINDKPCYIKYNYSIIRTKYDENDCIVEFGLYDINNMPCVENVYGAHRKKIKYDSYHYITEQSIYDVNDKPTISLNHGIFRQTYSYDDYHSIISSKSYGTDGKPCINSQEYCCEARYSYDPRGNIIKIECLDVNGKPCVCKEGYATIRYKYDNYGNCVEESYRGINGEPVYLFMCTSVQNDYFPNGLLKETRYYDENGHLCLNDYWYAISRYEYDKNGNRTKTSFFDKDTIPCYYKDGLYFSSRQEYDGLGNVIKETYFDTNGNISLMSEGLYAIGKYKYDNYHRIVEYAYYDEKEKPCYYDKDYHVLRVEYDLRGNVIYHSIFGTDGLPISSREGSEAISYKYDAKNNRIRVDYKNNKGKNINQVNSGYSTEISLYNEKNQLTSKSYFDKNGKPCLRKVFQNEMYQDYSKIVYRYDGKGNIIEYSYFDEKGEPRKANGYALYVTYDAMGRVIEKKYKNYKGWLCSGGNHHMAILRYKYGNKDNSVSQIDFYDTDSILQARLYQTFSKGVVIKKEIRDKENRLKSILLYGFTDTKYAMMIDSIDERGLNLKRSYYDENGKLGNIEEGFATLVNTYDHVGRLVSQELFDKNGKPVCGTITKFHKRTVKYNKLGLIEEECFYDENGRFVNTPYLNQCCKRTLYYDKRGILDPASSTSYISVNGNPVDESHINAPKEDAVERKADGVTIIANVELPGLFKDKGYEGTYGILEWNEWNLFDDLTKFSEVFLESLPKEKHLLMVPITNTGLGNVINVTFPSGTLGVRVMDSSSNALYNDLVDVYESYKKSKKQ